MSLTMGEHADDYMRQQMREQAAQRSREATDGGRHLKAHADALLSHLPSIDPSVVVGEMPSLTVRMPSAHQIQVMQDGKVFADWWPSKGTTMADGVRGPRCKNAAQVVAWLKDL
jgi:hypothetical protein